MLAMCICRAGAHGVQGQPHQEQGGCRQALNISNMDLSSSSYPGAQLMRALLHE